MSLDASNRQVKRLADYTSPDFTILTTELTFELDTHHTRVTARIRFKRLNPAATELVLDGQQLSLISLHCNEQRLTGQDFEVTDDKLRLPVAEDEFSLQIVTEISPQDNTALEGLYFANGSYCTQCEAEGFRRITYYLDRPDVLAIFTTTIIADAEQFPYLLANGNQTKSVLNEAGKREVSWHDPYPKPCYLFALVAGDFDQLTDSFETASGKNVSLVFYVEKGNGHRAGFALESLKRAMRWDEERFGLEYDLDIYMVVAVDFFNMGAMENKGLNVFNSKYVLANDETATDTDYFNIESIIGHEYFHNWTGNRVTCRDWFQLSLKEGLTVFRDQEFSRDMGSATVNRILAVQVIRTAQFAEDASPMAHPIRPEQVMEMNNFYTVTVYDKGAEVIRMLHTILGEEGFQAGMRLYFQRHDGQAVTCDDFVQAMQDATDTDLAQFRRWYQQSGTPELTVKRAYDAAKRQLLVTLRQQTPATADQASKEPLVLPVRYQLLRRGEAASSAVFMLNQASQQLVFDGVDADDLPVLLEDFSAPVRLRHDYQQHELLRIAAEADNGFARWDALQAYWQLQLKSYMLQPSGFQLPQELLELLSSWLEQPGDDLALTAELLKVPDYASFSEQYTQIPVDDILAAINRFKKQLADQLYAKFLNCYHKHHAAASAYSEENAAKRALKNLCLQYLSWRHDASSALLESQYDTAAGMTDRLAVLKCSQQSLHPLFEPLMQRFEQQWQHDVLVLDKWLSLKASFPATSVFTDIAELVEHPRFSWQNPNRVRAVFHAFAMQNAGQFHRMDGAGYQLLTETLLKLDGINAQVAARLVTPLLSWRRYEPARQSLMKNALQTLAAEKNISDDLYEKVSKALEPG
ncbi:MAG: aminopeptidase N [Alkalimonas sp.]|nr:aminopeptidase N [Alkalimonas sp.]